MNILLVGAGAVGKVYGRHLALGGAQVSFFVKEKHVASLQNGIPLYVLNERKKRDRPEIFKNFGVLTQIEEVKKQKWDYVILCVASPALQESWLKQIIDAKGTAALVSLQPGLNDLEFIQSQLPAGETLISGTIPIISFDTPMPGEQREIPGTAYWIPPGGFAGFSGPPSQVEPLLAIFKKGRFAVKAVANTAAENTVSSPALTFFISILENSDWSFARLKKNPKFAQACLAMREGVMANAHKSGAKTPNTAILCPAFFKSLIAIAPLIVPFDLERYLKVHFTKVSDQMHQSQKDYVDHAIAHHLPAKEMKRYLEQL
jgi:ketopantoate reductase